jgi:hypothetical protein
MLLNVFAVESSTVVVVVDASVKMTSLQFSTAELYESGLAAADISICSATVMVLSYR